MKIDGTRFGSITIDGLSYDHDVLIRSSGAILKRKKKLSKRIYGTAHTLSVDEAQHVYEPGCRQLILGTGQYDNVRLSPEAADFFERHDCRVTAQRTPDALHTFNETEGRKIGLFHVTC